MEGTRKKEKRELYDLRDDPGEQRDVLAGNPAVEEKLLSQLIDIVMSGSTRKDVESKNDTPPWESLIWLPR